MKLPHALGHRFGNRVNDFVIRQRVFPCDVVCLADGDIRFQTTEDRSRNIVHVNGSLQRLPAAKHRNDRRIFHETNQPPHIAVAWTAVDHRWAQDGIFQSARFDGEFRRHTDFLAPGVQLREDGGRADEDGAFDTRVFRGADDRVRVTEAEGGDVDERVRALHGGGQSLRVG